MGEDAVQHDTLAGSAAQETMRWLRLRESRTSLDDIVRFLQEECFPVRLIDERPIAMIAVFVDGSGVAVSSKGLDLLESANEKTSSPWDFDAWSGMSEREAFESSPGDVIIEMGIEIAVQSWSGGSWSGVYAYRGRYYAIDEVEVRDFSRPGDAFESAQIGNDAHDRIAHLCVDPRFEILLSRLNSKLPVD